MIVGNAPIRTCIACRHTAARDELTRFVFRPEQNPAIVHDVSATLPGRGCWVHPDETCLTKVTTKSTAFARAFRARITTSDLPQVAIEPKKSG